MSGDCLGLDATRDQQPKQQQQQEAAAAAPDTTSGGGGGRGCEAQPRKRQQTLVAAAAAAAATIDNTSNSLLSVKKSISLKQRADLKLAQPDDQQAAPDERVEHETSSLFTTTSDITTDDDAESIEIRIKQLVVEQEGKLGGGGASNSDDRFRSTPDLAANRSSLGYAGEPLGGRQQLCSGGGGGICCQAINLRGAKSATDLSLAESSSNGGGDGGELTAVAAATTRRPAFVLEPDGVPDVFVVNADEEGQQPRQVGSPLGNATQTTANSNNTSLVRARARSIASPPTPRADKTPACESGGGGGGSSGLDDDIILPFIRRNVSSTLLPERGNLRALNGCRSNNSANSTTSNEHQQQHLNRPNTAGSMEKLNLFAGSQQQQHLVLANGGVGSPAGLSDHSILNIRRSAWTLSDFDQTFNKSAIEQKSELAASAAIIEQQQKSAQYSAISELPRGSASSSDRQSTSLLIKASMNAVGQSGQIHSSTVGGGGGAAADSKADLARCNLSANLHSSDQRRASYSHSIVSIPSSVDSFNHHHHQPAGARDRHNSGIFNRKKHRSAKKAGAEMAEHEQLGCMGSCRCNLSTLSRYLPILEWLPNYTLSSFCSDSVAGLVVAALNISISLSAAVVAETDFGAAFRASIVNTFVYSILCSSRHASFGSWSIMSQMLLLSVKRALSDELILDRLNMGPAAKWHPEEYEKWHMNIIVMYTFLIGLVQLVCGALNLGNILSSFIPEALCSSLIAATAFTMAIGQLANMCGTTNKILWQIERNTTELWADLKNPPIAITDLFAGSFRWIQQILLLVKHYDQINLACVIISLASVILLFLNQYVIQQQLQKLFKRKILIPFEMILLIGMIVVSYLLNLAEDYNVRTSGPISIEFSLPNIPNLKLIRELWYDSLATALISYTMVYIMAKTYSNKLNYEVNYNQELVACGAGNLIGGLFDALPATASFSRTAGQVEAGGQTQMASIINCVLLVVLAHLLGEYVSALPICVMSAALFYGFTRMMTRFTEVFMYWRICRVDCAIWVVTFFAILAVDMVNGFIFGFIFSIFTMLYRAQNRRCYMLGSIGSSDVYVPLVKYPMAQEIEGIKIFQFCGPIHYVCADLFERLVRQKTRVNVKEVLRYISDQGIDKFNPRDLDLPTHIILDFSMISYIDSAGIHAIKKIIEDYQTVNITILVASLASHVAAIVKSEPSLWNVYKQRFYITIADAVHCAVRDRMRPTGLNSRGQLYT